MDAYDKEGKPSKHSFSKPDGLLKEWSV